MKRNRKNSIKKERIIMIASSAFVLAALTMTGVYIKESNTQNADDRYSIDFTALENSVDDKYQEIAQNNVSDNKDNAGGDNSIAQNGNTTNNPAGIGSANNSTSLTGVDNSLNMENDLDYLPLEAGSSLVEIPGLTDGATATPAADGENAEPKEAAGSAEADEEAEEDEENSGRSTVVSKSLSFSEADGLTRPVAGEILLHYSMDGSIYFATLDQYKYNPAVILDAEEGSQVSACAEGKVVSIYENEEIGKALMLDLGNGYQAVYGQLREIQVTLDSYVNPGETIGTVAAPTKYYSVEGANVYFQLLKDGVPVNPENLF